MVVEILVASFFSIFANANDTQLKVRERESVKEFLCFV
jgi:hypothetical protein